MPAETGGVEGVRPLQGFTRRLLSPLGLEWQHRDKRDKKGQFVSKVAFFVRAGNSTRELDAAEKAKYVLGRWPGGG